MSVDSKGMLVPAVIKRLGVRLLAIAVSLASLAGCITDVSVARHSTVAISDAEATQILGDFSAVILAADSPGDVACASDIAGQFLPALYLKEGAVTTYSGPDTINSQADFIALIQEPGYVKVVSAINWCGDFGPNIIGCGPIPGNTFAVVRLPGPLEGILWAHEFGHTVGLEHRNDSRAVMRATIGADTRDITLAECEQYLSKVNLDYLTGGSSPAPATAGASTQPLVFSASTADDMPVPASALEFVRQVYPHGTPMKVLAQIDDDASLPQLRAMLDDPAEAIYWGNVVVALGMLGDASDVPTLIRFADAQSSRSDATSLLDTSAALMALGYLANRTGDSTAVAYLRTRTQPEVWGQSADRQQQLVRTAHIGMAFSGQSTPAVRTSRRATELPSAMAAELEQLRARIASEGVRNYYRNR